MADGQQDTYVALPNGSYVHVPPNATPEQLSALKTKLSALAGPPKKAPGYEFGKEVTRGMGFDVDKIERIAATPEGGISNKRELLEMLNEIMKGGASQMERIAKDPFKIAEPIESVARGVEKGTGRVWKSLTEDDWNLGNFERATGELMGALANVGAGAEKGKPIRTVAGAPVEVAKFAGRQAAETAKRTGREFLGISEPAERAAREESHVEAREELGKFKEKELAAQEKDAAKTEAVRGKKAGEVREAQAERIQRSKLETKKSGLGVLKDRVAEKVAQNLDLAEKAEQASLNKRYAPFNKVIDAGKFDLAELENAIGESRKEIFKGTVQNEPIFNSILSRIKNKIEETSGETHAVPGENMINGSQLRGYISELGNEMFKNTELPADVYKGLKNVRETAKAMVQDYVDDAMGKQGGEAYRQLQRDWANYEQTWYDRSSGSPLRNALKTIRTTGRNVSVYREVANQLLREVKGEQALQWLGKKKQFGANPDLVAQLRRVDKEMKGVKVPGEVAEVQPPTLPKPTEVKPSEPTPFNPEQWRRQTIRDIAKPLGRPTGWDVAAIGYALREVLHGKFPFGLTYPIGKRVLNYLVNNPKVLDWLVKEQP